MPSLESLRRVALGIMLLISNWSPVLIHDVWGEDAVAESTADAPTAPLGQFITVPSPIDDRVVSHISTVAQRLLERASQADRQGILVLEIERGTSQFHHVQALSRLLTSAQFAPLKTVAWIPETVTGPNVLVALSCREIVMQPDAELGDIGRGQPVDPEDQQLALAIAQKRLNPYVSASLIRAMFDPQEQLWRVRLQMAGGDPPKIETRTVTRSELDGLRETGVVIEQAEVIKEVGVTGTFRGSAARHLDILAHQVAGSRSEVASLYHLSRDALREPQVAGEVQRVRLIRIEGMIDTLQESFLQRQMERAVASGSEVLIFEILSPGGELLASINLANAIADQERNKVRTIAYVPEYAYSGAAIIALGCDEIYLQPHAKIGDAGPIEVRPGQPFERAPEKILSPLRAALKTLADRKGRPVALAEAMADRSLKVFQATHRDSRRVWYMSEAEIQASGGEWLAGPQLRETNGELLLTVDGQRAHELQLAERPVHDLEELKIRIGLPANHRLVAVERNWVDTLVFILNQPAIVVLLFILGISCLYLEMHFPSGLMGIAACICFALFFWSKFLGGTAGWLEIVLFALGAGCLAMELLVIPGFGVFGLTGILLMLGSVIMASQSWGNLEPDRDLRYLGWTLGTFVVAMTSVIVLGVLLSRHLPQVPFFDSVMLTPPGSPTRDSGEPVLSPTLLTASAPVATSIAVGEHGVAVSLLRPAGKARFGERLLDVLSEGPYIAAGSDVEVVQSTRSRIVVRAI